MILSKFFDKIFMSPSKEVLRLLSTVTPDGLYGSEIADLSSTWTLSRWNVYSTLEQLTEKKLVRELLEPNGRTKHFITSFGLGFLRSL